ncbi:MAG: glutaredoxin 3 [Gammaproteobacteria bacterium]|nr:glutaredoxin 3 [Gammaproteobacteria bacterium]NND55541.1 glutaredoxin 3 [Gammaproteobacteria bacterium]
MSDANSNSGSTASVKLYGTSICGYCAAARRLLDSKGVAYEDIDVGRDPELRRHMEQLSGGRTVPQIFINDKPVGGYDDIAALEQAGELDKLLATRQPDSGGI